MPKPTPKYDPFGDEDEFEPKDEDEEPIPDDEIDEPLDEDEEPIDYEDPMAEYGGEDEKMPDLSTGETAMTSAPAGSEPDPLSLNDTMKAASAIKALGQGKLFVMDQLVKAQHSGTVSPAEVCAIVKNMEISEGDPAWHTYLGWVYHAIKLQNQSKEAGKTDPFCFSCNGKGVVKPASLPPHLPMPHNCSHCYSTVVGGGVLVSLGDFEKLKGQSAKMVIVDEAETFDEKTYEKVKQLDLCPKFGAKHHWNETEYLGGMLQCECGATKKKVEVPAFTKLEIPKIKGESPVDCQSLGKKHEWENYLDGGHICGTCGKLTMVVKITENIKKDLNAFVTEYQQKPMVCPVYGAKHQLQVNANGNYMCICGAAPKGSTVSGLTKFCFATYGVDYYKLTTPQQKACEKEYTENKKAGEVKLIDAKCPHYPQKKHNWEIQTLTKALCVQCGEIVGDADFVGELSIQNPKAMEKWIALDNSVKKNQAKLQGDPSVTVCALFGAQHQWKKYEVVPGGDVSEMCACGMKKEVPAGKHKSIPSASPCKAPAAMGEHKWIVKNDTTAVCVHCGGLSISPLFVSVLKGKHPEGKLPEGMQKALKMTTKMMSDAVAEKTQELLFSPKQMAADAAYFKKKLQGALKIPTVKIKGGKPMKPPMQMTKEQSDAAAKKLADLIAKQTEEQALGLQDTTSHEEIKHTKVASAYSETGVFEYKSALWHIYRVSPEIAEVSSKKPGHEHTGYARYFRFPKDWFIKSVMATFGAVGQLKGMGIKITEGTEIMPLTGKSLEECCGIEHPIYCCACNGWGKDLKSSDKPSPDCPACKGVGIVQNTGEVGSDYKCGVCEGFGQLQTTIEADGTATKKKCEYCKGTGKAKTPATYSSGLKEALKKKMIAEWGGDPDVDVSDAPKMQSPPSVTDPYLAKFMSGGFINANADVVMNDDGTIREIDPEGGIEETGNVLGRATQGALQGDPCEVLVTNPENIPQLQKKHMAMVGAQMTAWAKKSPCGCQDPHAGMSHKRLTDLYRMAIHPSVPTALSERAASHLGHLAYYIYGSAGILSKHGPPGNVKEYKAGTDIAKGAVVTLGSGPVGYGQVRQYEVGDNPKNIMGYAMMTVSKGKMVGVAALSFPSEDKVKEGPLKLADTTFSMPAHKCYFQGQEIIFVQAQAQVSAKHGNMLEITFQGVVDHSQPTNTKAKTLKNEAGLYPDKWSIDGEEFLIEDVQSMAQLNPVVKTNLTIRGSIMPKVAELKASDLDEMKPSYKKKLELYCLKVYKVDFELLNEENKKVCVEQFEKDGPIPAMSEKSLLDDMSLVKKLPKPGVVKIKGTGKIEDMDGWHHEEEGACLTHGGKVIMRIRHDGAVILDEDQHFLHGMSGTPLAQEFVSQFWAAVSKQNPWIFKYSESQAHLAEMEEKMHSLYKIIGTFALKQERVKARTEGDPMVARFQNIAQHLEDEISG